MSYRDDQRTEKWANGHTGEPRYRQPDGIPGHAMGRRSRRGSLAAVRLAVTPGFSRTSVRALDD